MNQLRRTISLLSLLFVLSACCPVCKTSGPLGALYRNDCPGELVCLQATPGSGPKNDRVYKRVVLDAGGAGCTTFVVSLPQQIPATGLPTVIVLGGIETGESSIEYIPDHEGYAVIAFQYPDAIRQVGFKSIFSVGQLQQEAYSVPQQIVTIAEWAQRQPWSNNNPASVIGISMGGLFMPAVYHLAFAQCVDLGPGVFAFTGAGIYTISYCNAPGPALPFFRAPLALFTTIMFNHLEPMRHLPCIDGEFLVINGLCDTVIPKKASYRLEALLPEDTEVIDLETYHILPERLDVIEETFEVAKSWLDKVRTDR